MAIYFLLQNRDFGIFTATLTAFAIIAGFTERISVLIGYLNHFTTMVTPFFDFMEFREEDGDQRAETLEEIVLENVSFRYPDAEALTINKVNLRLQKGETIALVGLNDSGKTTLSKLILGLYAPIQGKILYNAIDGIRLEPIDKYRFKSAVFQDFCRYPLTLSENVLISGGNNKLTSLGFRHRKSDQPTIPYDERNFHHKKDEALAWDCLAKVGIHHKNISYDMRLGKDLGYEELSGGQWQRLAIARGMYRENELLLDEPTSAIDPIQEAEIFTLFEELAKERTTIIVTHKLGAIKFADRIMGKLQKWEHIQN